MWGYYGFIGVTAAGSAAAAAAEISCARSTALSAGQIFSKLHEHVYGGNISDGLQKWVRVRPFPAIYHRKTSQKVTFWTLRCQNAFYDLYFELLCHGK